MLDFYSTHPEENEHIPYYAKYISLVPNGNILTVLEKQMNDGLKFLTSITEVQSLSRYAPDKWSIKEVLGHLSDNERIFAYRALRFARADKTTLPGYESDDYIEFGHFNTRHWQELISEFEAVRAATVSLFRSLDETAWTRQGIANNDAVSVRARAYIIAGHELHHLKMVREFYL